METTIKIQDRTIYAGADVSGKMLQRKLQREARENSFAQELIMLRTKWLPIVEMTLMNAKNLQK